MILFSLLAFLIFILMGFSMIRKFLSIVTVDGVSMMPTLVSGDRVLILRHIPTSLLRREQIAVFDLSKADSIPSPKPTIVIKRLLSLPGDVVRIHQSHLGEGVPFIEMSVLRDDDYYEMEIPAN